jgi:hypothetical protein
MGHKLLYAYKLLLAISWLAIGEGSAAAQSDSIAVTPKFSFADGVYLSFDDFKRNKPSYAWTDLEGKVVSNEKTYITKIEQLALKNRQGKVLSPTDIWGVCIDGLPYIKVVTGEEDKYFATFAGFRVKGRINYFSYEADSVRLVEIAAYNPVNGLPFRKGRIKKTEQIGMEKILHWETGEIVDLTLENAMKWIADDPQLYNTLTALSETEAGEKLLKSLMIYNDRNLVYLIK